MISCTRSDTGTRLEVASLAGVNFNFLNKANDFSIHCCSAATISGSISLENDTIIDPNGIWTCRFPSRSDLIPPKELLDVLFQVRQCQGSTFASMTYPIDGDSLRWGIKARY